MMIARMDPARFRHIISGRRRGPLAACCRLLLALASWPYAAAVRWRNRRYDRGKAHIHRAGVPVISVGNLTAGGTGKTPMVHWLAGWFSERDIPVAIVSRGYGAATGTANDEARELQQRLPRVPHVQNPDRVAAVGQAVRDFGCRLILLDDAFQHRRIHRDLDIVLIDALEPFGFGHLLPRGLLREPLAALRRADVVALSRSDQIDAGCKEEIRRQVQQWAGGALWIELVHRPQQLRSPSGTTRPLSCLDGRRVAAFCGIGNPEGFRRTLQSLPCRLVGMKTFPDHHHYTAAQIDQLYHWAEQLGAQSLVCTHKDLVKIDDPADGNMPLEALVIGLQIRSGQQALEEKLQQTVAACSIK